MRNNQVGRIGAAVTGVGVLSFLISLIAGLFCDALFWSCLTSMCIAFGFVPFMVSLYTHRKDPQTSAVGLAGIAFAAVYVTVILLVYFAQCTTVRMNGTLSPEALSMIAYGHIGSLFFNYDLLGYAMMSLSTLCIGFAVSPDTKAARALRFLLLGHGVFFLPCLILPMFPVFTGGTDAAVGTILLTVWCVYFFPVCVMGYRTLGTDKRVA